MNPGYTTVCHRPIFCLGKTEKTAVGVTAAARTVGEAGVPSAEHERKDGRGDENGIYSHIVRHVRAYVVDVSFLAGRA
jgi:hypothetical protein